MIFTPKQSIHVEKTVLDYGLRIWSDLPRWKIENVEGVVSTWEDTQAGYIEIYVDKRYSLYDIENKLKEMANET